MMPSLSSSASGKPLQLKDFLEEDTHFEQWEDAFGFQSAPGRMPDHTVRYLLAVELGDGNRGDRAPLGRRRSDGALTKLSALISAVKMAPFLSSTSSACPHDRPGKPGHRKQGGLLARSFSGKLSRGFWRRKWDKVEHRVERVASVRVRDVVRLRSFGDDSRLQQQEEEEEEEDNAAKTASRFPPSPVRSTDSGTTHSLAAWSDTESTVSDSFSCRSLVSCGEDSNRSPNEPPPRRPTCPANPSHLVRGVGEDPTPNPACSLERKAKGTDCAFSSGEVTGVSSGHPTRAGVGIDRREEAPAAAGGGKEMEGCSCHLEEEKDQLSPVCVMDFPFDDEENDRAAAASAAAASPVFFDRSPANVERTKRRLLRKIREFESLAALVEPVDLDSRFASSGEDETGPDRAVREDGGPEADRLVQLRPEIEERAVALLRELERRVGGGSSPPSKADAHGIDELLVDFFVERLSCVPCRNTDLGVEMRRRRDRASGVEDEKAQEAMLRAAADWVGGRHGKPEAHRWAAELREMEVGGDWRRAHGEEEEEVAGDLGVAVMDSLVGELVVDVFLVNQKSHLSAP